MAYHDQTKAIDPLPASKRIDNTLPVNVRKEDRAGIKAALIRLGLVRKFVTGIPRRK